MAGFFLPVNTLLFKKEHIFTFSRIKFSPGYNFYKHKISHLITFQLKSSYQLQFLVLL